VARGLLRRLVGMAADQGHHLRLLALREGGKDLVDGQVPEADDRPAGLAARWLRNLLGQRAARHRPEGAGHGETLPRPLQETAARQSLLGSIRHGVSPPDATHSSCRESWRAY